MKKNKEVVKATEAESGDVLHYYHSEVAKILCDSTSDIDKELARFDVLQIFHSIRIKLISVAVKHIVSSPSTVPYKDIERVFRTTINLFRDVEDVIIKGYNNKSLSSEEATRIMNDLFRTFDNTYKRYPELRSNIIMIIDQYAYTLNHTTQSLIGSVIYNMLCGIDTKNNRISIMRKKYKEEMDRFESCLDLVIDNKESNKANK